MKPLLPGAAFTIAAMDAICLAMPGDGMGTLGAAVTNGAIPSPLILETDAAVHLEVQIDISTSRVVLQSSGGGSGASQHLTGLVAAARNTTRTFASRAIQAAGILVLPANHSSPTPSIIGTAKVLFIFLIRLNSLPWLLMS